MIEIEKQTEEKIFEAATEVFVEKGMDGARMQDIASLAGINKALLHYYFRTKDQLFNKVFEMIAAKMIAKFSPVLDEKLSLEEKIRFFYKAHIKFLQDNPRLPGFILNEINRNPARIKKILKTIEFKKIWTTLYSQHKEELEKYNITEKNLPQIMTSIVSISVFPFAARGLLEGIFDSMGIDFDTYMEERKEFAAEFVIRAITKKVPGVS